MNARGSSRPKEPTVRERMHEAREQAILDAAQRLLVERGYAATSMDDLAAAVGASKATLYQHFPTKEDVAVAVISREMNRGADAMEACDPASPAFPQMLALLERSLSFRASMAAAKIEMLPGTVRSDPRYRRALHRTHAASAALIDRAKAEGAVDRSLPTDVVVQVIYTFYGPEFAWLVTSSRCSQADLTAALLRILTGGIAPRKARAARGARSSRSRS